MSEWHLDQLGAALTNRGWKLVAFHDGDDYAVSGSWEIRRSSRHPPLFIDFNGRDEIRCLPMSESFSCEVRGHKPSLYFRRPSDKWRSELEAFVRDLDTLNRFPRPLLPLGRIGDDRTMSNMLDAPRAILCLHAEWSVSSHVTWTSFRKWAQDRAVADGANLTESVALFVAVNSDHYPQPIVDWLKAQGLEHLSSAGHGELLWVERGRVVSKLIYSPDDILPELTRHTLELWGRDERTP